MQSIPEISIVIPLYNEADSISTLHSLVTAVMLSLGRAYELLIIDDGSKDNSLSLLKKLTDIDPHLKVIRLRRNFGQTAAFAAGFAHVNGSIIVTMDADLQNDPNDIPKLVAKIEEGYDVVSGWRKNRQDRFFDRRLPSLIANRLISNVTEVRLHDYGCSLKAYRRDVLKEVNLYGEMHRFIPALVSQVGGAIAEVPVNHHVRKYGKSKYGIGRTIRVILDLITVWFLGSYATRPLHVFGTIGLLSLGGGSLLGLHLSFVKLIKRQNIGGRPLLILVVLLVVIGIQLVTMGLLGELIIRTYYESQSKPVYVIHEIIQHRK